jgi:hypothetical protein
MRLFGIEAERPGYELHSFECSKCNHIQTAIGKARKPCQLRIVSVKDLELGVGCWPDSNLGVSSFGNPTATAWI